MLSVERNGQIRAIEAGTMEWHVEESLGHEPRHQDDTKHAWSGREHDISELVLGKRSARSGAH